MTGPPVADVEPDTATTGGQHFGKDATVVVDDAVGWGANMWVTMSPGLSRSTSLGSGERDCPTWIISGRLKAVATSCARRSTSSSFSPATSRDSLALTPTMKSRCVAIPSRNALVSARAMSMVSPSGNMPARPILISTRPCCGDVLATSTMSPMRSAPCEPASIHPVTPSERTSSGPSAVRAAWVWMSISPGTTSLPRAPIVSAASPTIPASTAAIRPCTIATSRIASIRSEGSMTRPPLMIRSYVAACANAFGTRVASATPAAAV